MTFLYIITERLLKEDATSERVLSFCRILTEINKEVIVISLDEVEPYVLKNYRDIKFISIRNISNSFFSKLSNFIFHSNKLRRVISSISKEYQIEGIFFYDIPPNSLFYLKKYVKENKIKLFHDSVEWYSSNQFKLGVFSISYILKNILNRFLIDKKVSVFAISNFLYNYFGSKGIQVLRIPIVIDINEVSYAKELSSNKLILIYAGSPGKKDYLDPIIEGILSLREDELDKLELHLFGITKKEISDNPIFLDYTKNNDCKSIIAHGRVSRKEVFSWLEKADFTVLLRSPTLRYAKAGFPTKVVESLATATPVICNITSDLGDFLIHNDNSLIIEGCNSKAFTKTLRIALALSIEEKKILSSNSRKTAEQNFDFRNYKEPFKAFLCKEH
jgi:glycosyltransferase involved in cell wall biosynthesis